MVRVNLKRVMNRESWLLFIQRAKAGLRLAARWVLIRHSHALDVAAVVLVLLMAVYFVVVLLYLEPPGVSVAPPGRLELATDVIDRLELWIEQLDAVRSAGLTVPEGVL